MKRNDCYNKLLSSQRNKDEIMISVIKRLFGERIESRLKNAEQRIDIQLYKNIIFMTN